MRKSIIAVIIAGILAAGAVITAYIGSDGFKNSDISTWFKSEKQEQTQVDNTNKETDNELVVIPDSMMSVRKLSTAEYAVNGISESAYGAYTLSVSFAPENTTIKTATFTAAWSDPESSWAAGKNVSDYITLSASSGESTTISCDAPFGAKIIITAVSDGAPALSATCTLDFAVKPLSFYHYGWGNNLNFYSGTAYISVDTSKSYFACYGLLFQSSDCTIYDAITSETVLYYQTLILTDKFFNELNSLSDEPFTRNNGSRDIPSSLYSCSGGYLYATFGWELVNYFLDRDIPDSLLSVLKSRYVSDVFDIHCSCTFKGTYMDIGKVYVSFYSSTT